MGNSPCCAKSNEVDHADNGLSLPKGILLGIGNPLLDIVVDVEPQFLQKHGLKQHDAIMISDDRLDFYQDLIQDLLGVYDKGIKYIAGGSAQNVIRVAQWILSSWNATVFMGAIGADDFGKILFHKLLDDGVIGQYQIVDSFPTGTCLALINNTRRTLVACLGAAECFRTEFLRDPQNFSWVESAQYYFISGFFLSVNSESALLVARFATDQKRTFAFHLSAPYVCSKHGSELKSILPYVDVLFGNVAESEAFATELNFGVTDSESIALKAAAYPKENSEKPRLVVITQGSKPVIVAHDGKVSKFVVKDLPSSDIVDQDGAGDAFVGGFLAQMVLGSSIQTCVGCGNWAAAEVLKSSGCTFPKQKIFNADFMNN